MTDILKQYLAGEPSDWKQDAQSLRENREWLKVSQKLALKILRTLREEGITQKELANRMNVSPQQINKWVRGNENFTIETLVKIGNVLGITLINIPDKKGKIKKGTFKVEETSKTSSFKWGSVHAEKILSGTSTETIDTPEDRICEVA